MASLNRYQLIGKLADDPELKYTPTGKTVTNFTVEVESELLQNFDYVSYISNSIPVQAWGQLGELCTEHLQKGSLIYLEGYLTTTQTVKRTTYRDEEFGDSHHDEIKYYAQVVAKKVEFLDKAIEKSSIQRNKDKILESIQMLENVNFYSRDSGLLQVLEHLRSLDFDSID